MCCQNSVGKPCKFLSGPKGLTELVVYICHIKNYPCQLIKRRIRMYRNILRKKVKKIDNRCYSTSNISCLSQVHILLLLATILWVVFYMFRVKKKLLTEIFCNLIDFCGPISEKKLDVTITILFLSDNQYFEIPCTVSHSMGDT